MKSLVFMGEPLEMFSKEFLEESPEEFLEALNESLEIFQRDYMVKSLELFMQRFSVSITGKIPEGIS